MSRPQSKFVAVNANDPAGAAQCDRCGHWFNLRDLTWQYEWGGVHLYNKRVLVCTVGNRCVDKPAEFLRTIILPPDPLPLKNPRVPDFDYEEQTARIIQFGDTFGPPWASGPMMVRATQSGEQVRVIQYLTQSLPGVAPDRAPDFILGQTILGDGSEMGGAGFDPRTGPTGKFTNA